MHAFFKSTFFNFEALRIISTTATSGAEIGEALQAIDKIKDNDPASWRAAWSAAAETAQSIAADAHKSGNRAATRSALLRAANYLRAAEYMDLSFDTLPLAQQARQTFRKALDLFDHPVIQFDIPYTHTDGVLHNLPAILYLPASNQRLPNRKIPVLLITNGADSTSEELYHLYGAYGPPQGYATLTFDGPGQGIVLRKDRVLMRPDWEIVIAAVLDKLTDLNDSSSTTSTPSALNLDLQRIGIVGASMGGYFALRGAVDPRITACVAIDPFFDMWDFATTHVSPLFLRSWEAGWISDGMVDGVFGLLTSLSFQMRWEVGLTARFFGTKTPSATLKEMKRYSLKHEGFLKRIRTAAVLVSGAPLSLYFDPVRHTYPIVDGLTELDHGQKQLWMPTKDAAQGGYQGKVGAFGLSAQKTFAFLDEVFEVKRPSLENTEAPDQSLQPERSLI